MSDIVVTSAGILFLLLMFVLWYRGLPIDAMLESRTRALRIFQWTGVMLPVLCTAMRWTGMLSSDAVNWAWLTLILSFISNLMHAHFVRPEQGDVSADRLADPSQ